MMLQHVFFLFLFALKEENNNTISKENIFFCTRNIIIIIYIIQFYNYLEYPSPSQPIQNTKYNTTKKKEDTLLKHCSRRRERDYHVLAAHLQ
jgi:hypothetical protein